LAQVGRCAPIITQVKTIHAKITNHRKNALHKFSRELVIHCGEIYAGHVSSVKLVKTKMAKSVLDAGWGQLKTMLDYKCAHAGVLRRYFDSERPWLNLYFQRYVNNRGCLAFGAEAWLVSSLGAVHVLASNLARAVALSLYCFLWAHCLGCQGSSCR
jgi:hypothetical protein